MTALGPLAVYSVADAIRVCAHDALAETAAGPPARSCVVWGPQVVADGCDCGQLAVTVTRLYPSTAFPDEAGPAGAGTMAPCGPPYLIADLTVSILRCIAVPGDGEVSVPCATLAAEARTAFTDAHTVRTAVHCCLADLLGIDTISEFLIVDQVPTVGGGCAGSELRCKVELVDPCPCEGVA